MGAAGEVLRVEDLVVEVGGVGGCVHGAAIIVVLGREGVVNLVGRSGDGRKRGGRSGQMTDHAGTGTG